ETHCSSPIVQENWFDCGVLVLFWMILYTVDGSLSDDLPQIYRGRSQDFCSKLRNIFDQTVRSQLSPNEMVAAVMAIHQEYVN
ncbi:hypothetical protein HK405_009096, partial [Cladochytrium tenue]